MYYQFIYLLSSLIPYQSNFLVTCMPWTSTGVWKVSLIVSVRHFYGEPKPGKEILALLPTLDRDWWLQHMLHWKKKPVGLSERISNQMELIRDYILILDFISDLSVFTLDFTYPLFTPVEPVQVRSIHMKRPFQHKYQEYSQRGRSLI